MLDQTKEVSSGSLRTGMCFQRKRKSANIWIKTDFVNDEDDDLESGPYCILLTGDNTGEFTELGLSEVVTPVKVKLVEIP